MAHDGTGTGWDTAAPADADPRKDGAKEIRDLRLAMGIRIDKEHVALGASSAGGEHKLGSGMAYNESGEPTNRPDGSTALTAADKGRLWTKLLTSGRGPLYYYDGSAWFPSESFIAVGALTIDTTYSSFVTVGYPFQAIMFYHTGGHNFFVNCALGADEEIPAEFIDTGGGLLTITVNSDQDGGGPYRFRAKSAVSNGNSYRYRVLP